MSDEIKALEKIVSDHASLLAEHFDTIRIFATKHGDGSASNTMAFSEGRGSFYTQLGHISEWLEIQKEYARHKARKDQEEEEGPDLSGLKGEQE